MFAPSTIETADLCLRKWAFDKIDRLPRAETEATKLGGEVHEQIENYLKHGKPFDVTVQAGKIAMSALSHLPEPKLPGMTVEKWFVRKTGVATYWGKKDGEQILTQQIPKVWDHKTCGSFRYANDVKGLQTKVQPGMYGWDAIAKAQSEEAELRWNYMRTKGSRACVPVIARISKMQAEDVMCRVDRTAEVLIQLTRALPKGRAREAPPNFSACDAFGGCARKPLCNPDAKQAFVAMVEQMTVNGSEGTSMATESLLDDLKNRKNKKKGGTTAASTESAADTAEPTDTPINPPDRDQPPPPAPAALKANGKWFQVAWDEADWKWVYPPEYEKALADEKAAEAAAAKAAAGSGKAPRATAGAKTSAGTGFDGLYEQLVEDIATRVAAKLSK